MVKLLNNLYQVDTGKEPVYKGPTGINSLTLDSSSIRANKLLQFIQLKKAHKPKTFFSVLRDY